MKKKFWLHIILLLCCTFLFTVPIHASNIEYGKKYQIGANVYCYIQKEGETDVIHLEGAGATYDYESDGYDKSGKNKRPDNILLKPSDHLYISDGITVIGKSVLPCQKYIDHVSNTLKEVKEGNEAFDLISYKIMPRSLQYFPGFHIISFPDIIPHTWSLKELSYDLFFARSQNIKEITISNTVTRIKQGTFKELTGLRVCVIPPSVIQIDGKIFWRNTDNITIKGYKNSYAEFYAKKNNIKFKSIGTYNKPIKHTIYSIGNFKYRFEQNKTLTVMGLTNKAKKISSLNIPSKATLFGKKYKVASIYGGAFQKNKYITKITLGNNISSIYGKAFYHIPRLKYIKFTSSKVPIIKNNAFNNNHNIKFYIPKKIYNKTKKSIIKSKVHKTAKYIKY